MGTGGREEHPRQAECPHRGAHAAVRGPGTKICVKLSPEECWDPLNDGEASGEVYK